MKTYFYIILLFFITGCATNMDDVADKNSPTMKEIYNGKSDLKKEAIKAELARRIIEDKAVDLSGYTRDSYNENQVLFKKLANPVLVGYVYPHLTKEETPIPGYAIPFRMSPRDYYVMPGENRNLKF